MQIKIRSVIIILMCFAVVFSSCTKNESREETTTDEVSSTDAETTTSAYPTKIATDSSAEREYETVKSDAVNENYKIFVNYNWIISDEYFKCYYNPENKENPYYLENRYGIADKNGNIIIEPQFGSIFPSCEDRFIVANGVKYPNEEFVGKEYALLNEKGEMIIPFVRSIADTNTYYDGLQENYYFVSYEPEKYYLLDKNGNKVYDMVFSKCSVLPDSVSVNTETYSAVCDGKIYFFDKDLNIIKILDEKPVEDEHLTTHIGMEYAKTVCFKNDEYYYGVINKTTGREIVPCKYEEITIFAQNRILVSETRGLDNTEWKFAIYDLGGTLICPEDKYCRIDIVGDGNIYHPVGIASAPNPNGDRIYGEWCEWLIDKNGIKISDTYCHIYYNQYGEMAGYYTADRGDRVFYLDKNGEVVGTIGR